MNRSRLLAALVTSVLITYIAEGGSAAPPGLTAGSEGGSHSIGEPFLPLPPNISFTVQNLAAQDWYERGFTFTGEERYAEAVIAYEQALAANRSLLNAWYYLGYALYRLDRPREALLALGNARAIDPDFVDAYFYEGLIYGKLGILEEEKDALGRGLEAAERRRSSEAASNLPSAPGPHSQDVPAVIPVLATVAILARLAFNRLKKGQ